MSNKNKHRLYVTLQTRGPNVPGFHCALLLAPKRLDEASGAEGGFLFHAINNIIPENLPKPGERPPWRYETKAVKPDGSKTLSARILVAKFFATTPFSEVRETIDRAVRQVPIVQNDPQWTCVSWLIQSLVALRDLGGEYATIPQLVPGSELERKIETFGNEGAEWRNKETLRRAPLAPRSGLRRFHCWMCVFPGSEKVRLVGGHSSHI